MKHSDYQAKVNEFKALECEELKLAIEAHGGCYEWDSENDGSYPIIAVNSNKIEPEPQDIEIIKVAIVDGQLKISGVDKVYGEPVKFDTDDIFAGHLSFIIDYIPATDEVSDVSIPLPPKTYKLQVGDKVWLFNTDRRDKASDRYGEVTKIARKYFYVKSGIHSEERFYMDTFKHDNGECSPCYELFVSKEACEFCQKAKENRRAIGNRLLQFLTDEEVCELYETLSKREIKFSE